MPLRAAGHHPIAMLAVLAGCALCVAGCGGGGSSSGAPTRHASPLISIFEADPQLHADPAGTLDLLRRLGVDVVRVYVPWGTIAPDGLSAKMPAGFDGANPAAYPQTAWTTYDEIVRDAHARGIGVYLTLGGPPPQWAAGRGAPRGNPHPQWRPSPSEFGAFVRAVGSRYNGRYTPPGAASPLPRVDFWSIWNEPNYGPDLAPQAIDNSTVEVSPLLYRGLLDAAWSALGATGHGHDTILIGELAPRGITIGNSPGNFSGMVPLRFLRALYCVDSSYHELRGAAATARGCPADAASSRGFRAAHPALFDASGFAAHTYPQGAEPPTFVTPNEPDYADFARLPKLETTLERLRSLYGTRAAIPIYSTEFGYKTDPPYAGGADPATAAADLNWAEYLSWRDGDVRSFDQYLLIDPPGAGLSNFATGLETADGTPKLTYVAYRLPLWLPRTSFSAGQSLEVWGCARPARFAELDTGHRQRVAIQFQRSGHGRFVTVAKVRLRDRSGYFDVDHAFPASGVVRLAWRYPHGPQIFSRTIAVTAH